MTLQQALEAAMRLQQSSQPAQAERVYRQILSQHADCAEAAHLLGVLCAQSGRNEEGIEWIRKAVDRHPEVGTFQINLANAFLGCGRLDEAIQWYRRALSLEPNSAAGWSNLGSALIGKENFDDAEKCARHALALRPEFADAMVVLGNAILQLGQTDEAIDQYQRAIELNPNLAPAYDNLGLALAMRRRFDEALAAFDKANALRPDSAAIWTNRAKTLRDAGRRGEAEAAARRAVALAPRLAEAHVNLALALHDLGRIDESVTSARQAIALRPELARAHNVLANALKEAGDVAGAIAEFDRSIELRRDNPVDLSNKIYLMQFDPRFDAKAMLAEQKKWNAQFGANVRSLVKAHGNERQPDRRLRIGYVSPFFFGHAEAFFVVPLLENHDRGRFEIHCYSDAMHSDGITARMKRCVDGWHSTASLSDNELAEKIRADSIDILVDLTMHMAHNRAMVFAQKPAPAQVCWLAYPGGTGLETMDYRISDPWIDPADADDSVYVERTIRLPRTWVCYDPLSDAAPVSERQSGPICFGSINNPCKLNDGVLRLWARVMREASDSRLVVQAIAQSHRTKIVSVLGEEGISRERVQFLDRLRREDYLRLYDRIDVCLDPLPYNGITTTCDALWMGVPVVTLMGKTAAGRAAASILRNVGLGEWVARDKGEFVGIAAGLARDLSRLDGLRNTLRGRINSSPVMDGKGFARDMEAAFSSIFKR